jgi:hypothetical protein
VPVEEEEAREAQEDAPLVRRAAALVLASAAGLLAAAAPAAAHGVVDLSGATIVYTAIDDPTVNNVTVTGAPGSRCGAVRCVQISDTTVDPGMDAGPCAGAGGENPHTVYCPWRPGARVRMDLGQLDDRAEIDVPIPARLKGGPGDDTLVGGPRADLLLGGSGADSLSGGGGRDVVEATDGAADRVTCGRGLDLVDGDVADMLAGDCENYTKVPDPNGTAPVLQLAIASRSRRAVVARIRTGRAARVTLAGRAGGRALASKTVGTGAGRWTRVRLSIPRAAFRRRHATLTLVARSSDGSGGLARTTLAAMRLR